MENLMNVSFGKVTSARLPVTGENGVYKVKANLTFNESKEITNADGTVSIAVSNAEVANFNKDSGNSLNVRYQTLDNETQCAINGAINACLNKAIEAAKNSEIIL